MNKDDEILFLKSRIEHLYRCFKSTETIMYFMVERMEAVVAERKALRARVRELENIINNINNT